MRRRALVLAAALLLAPAAAPAQDGIGGAPDTSPKASATPWRESSCLAALPPDSLHPALVLLDAHPVTPLGDALAELVGERLRAYLGGGDDALPAGEPAVHWMDVPIALDVTLRQDGDHFWALPDSAYAGDLRPSTLRYLLMRAVAEVRDAGPRLAVPVDSTLVRLRLRHPILGPPDVSLRVVGLPDARGVPVFTLAVPRETPVVARSVNRPPFPDRPLRAGVGAAIGLMFLVDADGRVPPQSVREVRREASQFIVMQSPSGRYGTYAAPGGHVDHAAFHADFVNAARTSVLRSRFAPARIGGCGVPQLVYQPFVFSVDH